MDRQDILTRAKKICPADLEPSTIARRLNREFELELAAAQGIMFRLKPDLFAGIKNVQQVIVILLDLLDVELTHDKPGWP